MPKKERDETEAKIKQALLDVLEGRTGLVVRLDEKIGAFVLSFTPGLVVNPPQIIATTVDEDIWDESDGSDAPIQDVPEDPDDVVGEEDLAPDERTSDIDVVPL